MIHINGVSIFDSYAFWVVFGVVAIALVLYVMQS